MNGEDACFDTQDDALDEVRRRRSDPDKADMIVRCEQTGYGNWLVRSIPADLIVEALADGPSVDMTAFGTRQSKSAWAR